MTQLERELQQSLKLQEEMFSKELRSISREYEQSIRKIKTAYEKQMSEALMVIERQDKTLEQYRRISTNWQISLDDQALKALEDQVMKLGQVVDSLAKSYNLLADGLSSLEKKL